jgi:hypothetical protein
MNTECDRCQDENCAVNIKKIYQNYSVASSHLLSPVKYQQYTKQWLTPVILINMCLLDMYLKYMTEINILQ